MLVLLATFLGLLGHALAQFPGDCDQESALLSCIPQATVCSGNIPASISSCGCTNIQTVMNCYSTYCSGQLTDDFMLALSSESNVVCNGIGSISFPSGIVSSDVPTSPASTIVNTTTATSSITGEVTSTSTTSSKVGATITGTSSGTTASPTSSGAAVSATSKAAAERGMGHAVPVLGGVLGALIGIVGMILFVILLSKDQQKDVQCTMPIPQA
ncbi:hypothetical protein OIDMADRAFT_34673 [Oidiodendron maius Zn]|uniref:Extracellular membrane protein CFEM domain-containing protein n=1 Tax=Oidiodendron maius (strain Zn) TaxID=913774 RepID=A0A0C3GTQ0_OIDMZ|nr:hypothetical protein OIDMADRAFT_34673 [Oidiodendron maius Zn]